ncbi:hypothetical protein LG634_23170 [Streptomyces bambusae]|uniref:hypothetical protein n=1 Tax=Streptomyces bambusae TaxID=1550616 RepID=UPI001CFC47B5|nr:hypothetical protein [Streptomyces bambusae]MCB5167720.1 hypothetical protein [Streptomyces bambusae]
MHPDLQPATPPAPSLPSAPSADPARPDLRIDWRIPATPPGLSGWLDRFTGPGKTRSETVAETAGAGLCAVLLAAGIAATDLAGTWSGLQLAVVVLMGLDVLGGILTNATNSAKRWYHRPGPGARRTRLLFVSAHLLHLAATGLVVLDGDWRWTLANTAVLLCATAVVECAPVHLKRPVAMAAYTAAVLINLFWLTLPVALAWFAPLFFLKLLVCHLIPEAPLEKAADDD